MNFTMTVEILARALVNFHCQYISKQIQERGENGQFDHCYCTKK